MVVVDATPLVPVSDARIIARYGKATVIVVASAGTATRRQIRRAVERLSLISLRADRAPCSTTTRRRGGKTAYYGCPRRRRLAQDRRRARLAATR